MIPKFRAWDKQYKTMHEVWEISYLDPEYPILLSDYYDGAWASLGDVVVMQSTGLKDSKGIEIYEGDIISERVSDTETLEVIVVWYNGGFYGKEKGYTPDYLISEFLKGEVIGNIHGFKDKTVIEEWMK